MMSSWRTRLFFVFLPKPFCRTISSELSDHRRFCQPLPSKPACQKFISKRIHSIRHIKASHHTSSIITSEKEVSQTMNYSCFLEEITRRVKERLPEEYEVTVRPVRKNNGVMQDTIMIRRPSTPLCPNIYVQQIYRRYLDGMTMEQAEDAILQTYHNASSVLQIDAEELINQEIIRNQVVYRLVNRERNQSLLEEIPYKPFLDLALIYYVIVENEEMGTGGILVRNHFLDYYHIRPSELDEAAARNTPKLFPADFIGISDLLREFGEKTGAHSYSEISLEEDASATGMYVLTNRTRQFGACYLADKEVLSEIAGKLNSDLFLLPSSVHECMVVSADYWEDPESLADMVREINRTQVSRDEYLADTVYRFCREDRELLIAA